MGEKVEISWTGDDSGLLSQWFFSSGSTVQEGDVLCEVMQEKVIVEISAPTSGKLEIVANEEDEVEEGHTLAYIFCD